MLDRGGAEMGSAGVGREVPDVGQKGVVKCWSDGREVSDVGRKRDGRCWSEGKEVLSVGQKKKKKKGKKKRKKGRLGCFIIMLVRGETVDPGQEGMCWVLVRMEMV